MMTTPLTPDMRERLVANLEKALRGTSGASMQLRATEALRAFTISERRYHPSILRLLDSIQPIPFSAVVVQSAPFEELPDDTLCTLEEWNQKIDALLAECQLTEEA